MDSKFGLILTEEEGIFQEQFKKYFESVPSEVVGPIMANNPGEGWRVILIRQSKLRIPKRLEIMMNQYDKLKEISNEGNQVYKEFISQHEVGSIDKKLYGEFRVFCREYGYANEDHYHKFKELLEFSVENNRRQNMKKSPFDYELMKLSVMV
jgi:hypothetical protein